MTQVCQYVHDCLRDTVIGFIGTVVIGSIAYLGDDDDGDIDLIMLTNKEWPIGCSSLERLRLLLHGGDQTSTWTAFVVNARVPILKCTAIVDGRSWSIDILHSHSDISHTMDAPTPLETAVCILPTNAAVGLAMTLCVRLRESRKFNRATLILLRQWAKKHHVYGSTVGYPGGSAWAVLLFVYCTVSPGPAQLRGFLVWLCQWLTDHADLPVTVHNARILHEGGSLADHADWAGLRHSISRYARVMCILPFPWDAVEATTANQLAAADCDMNMTSTVGPLQHGVLLHELQCSIEAHSDAAMLTATRHNIPDLLVNIYMCHKADCCSAWLSHVEARGLLLLTNQLHIHGLCGRIRPRSVPAEDGESTFTVAVWLGTTSIQCPALLTLVRNIFHRINHQYTQEHQCNPTCPLVVGFALGSNSP